MGFLRDLLAAKEEIWQGEDLSLYEKNCDILKEAGYKIQAVKLNTQMEGCSGECASCSTCMELNIEARTEKSCEAVNDKYAIYVKQTDANNAKKLLVESV